MVIIIIGVEPRGLLTAVTTMAAQRTAPRAGRGTPYNPLVVGVMEEVFGPTAGEDRPQLHPHAQLAVQTLVEIARNNPRFEPLRHACPSPFLSDASHAAVRLEWLRHHLSCESRPFARASCVCHLRCLTMHLRKQLTSV